ncbi:MAG: chorismate-binding protein [Bacteroidia bacterium]|nr:chorismate-binding protein [Bacteroidia bacterium]
MLEESRNIALGEEDLFVVYRMPRESNHYLILDRPVEEKEEPQYQFIIHPFDKSSSKNPGNIISDKVHVNPRFEFYSKASCSIKATNRDEYMSNADNLIEDMKSGQLEKVVLSRIHLLKNEGTDLYDLFINMTEQYPNAFVYLFHIPGDGTWMGATPEILMEWKENKAFTVALAATQQVDGRSVDKVEWGKKEIEEQAIIQRYIEDALKEKKFTYTKGETSTTQAGSLYHLKTLYEIRDVESLDTIVELLHPGPAICGNPQNAASERIKELESHDREYYCGYLGLKTSSVTRLFINLRCMQVFQDHFALYVGGGLTKDSNSECEWNETVAKTKTLESAIQKSYIYAHGI